MAIREPAMTSFTLQELARRIKERAAAGPDVSYTRKLLDKGVAHCAKKLGEEAVETALAAVSQDREALIAEAADLLYHLLVVLESRDVALAEVEAALARRMTKSGLEEKASRPRD
jgi:phosphoribosyl-ATP pyrophosphohydrolase